MTEQDIRSGLVQLQTELTDLLSGLIEKRTEINQKIWRAERALEDVEHDLSDLNELTAALGNSNE